MQLQIAAKPSVLCYYKLPVPSLKGEGNIFSLKLLEIDKDNLHMKLN